MLQLFLSETASNDNGDDVLVEQRKSLLKDLESVIWSLISSGHRSEARLWLCDSLAGISSLTPHHQHELFVALLRSKTVKRQRLAAQILQLLFEKQPHIAGPIIAKKSYLLEDFFKGKSFECSEFPIRFNARELGFFRDSSIQCTIDRIFSSLTVGNQKRV